MVSDEVSVEELEAVREKYITLLNESLADDEKQFLLSLKQGQPAWNKLSLPGLDRLPAIQWKLLNISKMNKTKHAESIQKLKDKLKADLL